MQRGLWFETQYESSRVLLVENVLQEGCGQHLPARHLPSWTRCNTVQYKRRTANLLYWFYFLIYLGFGFFLVWFDFNCSSRHSAVSAQFKEFIMLRMKESATMCHQPHLEAKTCSRVPHVKCKKPAVIDEMQWIVQMSILVRTFWLPHPKAIHGVTLWCTHEKSKRPNKRSKL